MGRMIRIELYRAFHGKELKTAMLLGGLLGLAHFVLEVIPSVSHIFDGYHLDIASSVVGNVTESWMGGMINPEINIYQMVVFLLITIPYAASFYTDRKAGILKNIAVRGEKREYLAAKSVAVFMTAGVSAVFPLLLNLMLTMTMFPVINYDWYQLPNYKALFMNLAVKNVIAYCIVYMALIFVFAGLIAGLALSLSLYANNRFVVLSLPFLICIVSGRLVAYSGNPVIRGLAIQKVFYVPQSSPTTLVSLCILFVVLVLCGYVHFMVRGVKMDVL